MRRLLACLGLCAASGAAHAQPAAPLPEGPNRQGFTIELDGGIGATRVTGANIPNGLATRPSVGGIDIGLGWFVTSEVAIELRLSAQTYWLPLIDTNHIASHAFIGPAFEWWLGRGYIGGGAGLGVDGGQDQGGSNTDNVIGLGFTGRSGYAISQNEGSSWRISYEVNFGWLEGRRALSAAFLIGWQSF